MTIYQSSKGEIEIATMPHRYASNALAKLIREEPERTDEIDALTTHIAKLDKEYADAAAQDESQ